MSAILNTATMRQIQAELLARAIARGMWQITQAEQALAALRRKQEARLRELDDQACVESAALNVSIAGLPVGNGDLPYWQLVRRLHPEAKLPYIDLVLRCREWGGAL